MCLHRRRSPPINGCLDMVLQFPDPIKCSRNHCWLSRGSQISRDLPEPNIYMQCCPQNDGFRGAVVVVITPPLPRDGGTVRTAIQIHAVNLIEITLQERWQPISNQSLVAGSPTTIKADCHWWIPKSRFLRHAGLPTSQL